MNLYIRGKALNVTEEYSAEAERALGKAAKLAPGHAGVWNSLGECFWKKRDYAQARDCFSAGLSASVTAEGLRCLSMVLRMLPASDFAARRQLLDESLEKARTAVALDVNDGRSWYTLGNAFLTVFFTVTQAVADLESSLKAYKRAEDCGGAGNPDLHFNRANVFLYLEDYPRALQAYARAHEIDPAWAAPSEAIEAIARSTRRTVDQIRDKAGLSRKKLNAAIADLTPTLTVLSRTRMAFRTLQPGPNPGVAVVCKVVADIVRPSEIPQTFIVVDEETTAFAVSVYNMRKHGITGGAELWLPDPFVFVVSVTLPGETEPRQYSSIRVDNPNDIAVNGVPASGLFARTAISIEAGPGTATAAGSAQ